MFMVIDLIVGGGSMDSEASRRNLDVEHLQKVGGKVSRLLRRQCKDAIEAMYVLKAILYLLRCELSEAGIVLRNEAQLDAELVSMIDKAMKKSP
jgi:hypothetical protein